MWLHCDNFSATPEGCRSATPFMDTLESTHLRARARGWHIYVGLTHGGVPVTWVLCDKCVGRYGRPPRAPEVLPGQEELF